jgi:hypothetical protein
VRRVVVLVVFEQVDGRGILPLDAPPRPIGVTAVKQD